MFLGAIFRTIKGGYDAVTIRKKIKEYNEELSKDLLESFPPYERFFARERMLLAEYMIELSKLKARKHRIEELFALRERMNRRMKEVVAQAEQELEARNATKLDVARVVNSLRELSLAMDRDLNSCRKEFTAEQKRLLDGLKDLDYKMAKLSGRLEEQSQETAALQKKAGALTAGFEEISKGLRKQELNLTKYTGLIWGFNIIMTIVIIVIACWR
ncbi:MAG: hypothetical protein ACM3X9_01460 [Bacillota bacterium]